jgi:peptide/nickel transport system permease protein
VVGIVLQFYFAVVLGWLPVTGAGGWRHLILPAISLGVFPVANITRLLRTGLAETLRAEYVHTARAKGLSEMLIVLKHALRTALIPTVTVAGMQFGLLLGAAVFAESIFAWPGLGRYLVQAVSHRDYPVIQGAVLAFGATFVGVNAAVDLLYCWIDPRIRY